MGALQFLELEVLQVAREVAELLQVLDVVAPLAGLARVGVHEGDLRRLGEALGGAADHRLVDPLLDDLVADVVRAVHVEAFLVEPEPDRERRVLDEDQVRHLERHRQAFLQPIGPDRDAAGDHELPEPQVLEIQRIEGAVLEQRAAGIDAVIHAVGLLLLEVVGAHGLGGLILEVDVPGDGLRDERHALVELPTLGVDGADPGIDGAPVRLDALADGGAEGLEMIEEGLDVGPEEADDRHLVARAEAHLAVGDVGVDAVGELVEDGQRPDVVGGAEDLPRQAELGEEIGLDGPRALGGRPADVRDGVERVDITEHDGLHLGRDRAGRGSLALEAVEDRLAEAPLDDGVDGRALLLDEGLDTAVQFVHAALDGHGEERQHLFELGRVERGEVAGIGRAQFEGADRLLLVVQRRHHDAPHAALEQAVLDFSVVVAVGRQVLDEQRLALETGAHVDGPCEVGDLVVDGVGEEAGVVEPRAVVEREDPVALDGGETQAQRGPPEERPELGLQSIEARGGDDRFLVDQVALEGREHLLVGDIEGPEDGEAAEREAPRRNQRGEGVEVGAAGLEARADLGGERGRLPRRRLDLDEAAVEVDLVVAVQPGLGIVGGEDERVVHGEVDPVHAPQHLGIRVEEAEPAERLLVHVEASPELAVRAHQVVREGRRRVEALELEGDERGGVLLLPEDGREHRGHQRLHQLVVSREDPEVADGLGELGRLAQVSLENPGEPAQERVLAGAHLLPEADQGLEAQLALEREVFREVRGSGLKIRQRDQGAAHDVTSMVEPSVADPATRRALPSARADSTWIVNAGLHW